MPAIYGSLERLNAIYDVFTTQGNKRLGAGEVDALAGFYSGLKAESRAKIESRLAEIYQASVFERGQKARFLSLLNQAGLSTAKLEGQPGDNAASFLKMSKTGQFDRLKDLEGNGNTLEITYDCIARDARAKIKNEMKKIEAALDKKYKNDETYSLGDKVLSGVFGEGCTDAGDTKAYLGYTLELGIYADEHDVDRRYYFNLKGDYLGNVYCGE